VTDKSLLLLLCSNACFYLSTRRCRNIAPYSHILAAFSPSNSFTEAFLARVRRSPVTVVVVVVVVAVWW